MHHYFLSANGLYVFKYEDKFCSNAKFFNDISIQVCLSQPIYFNNFKLFTIVLNDILKMNKNTIIGWSVLRPAPRSKV